MHNYSSWRAKLILATKGFAMGLADVIPGVSGGTIALISGIYDHLIQAIGSVQAGHVLNVLELLVFCWHAERRRHALERLAQIEWAFLLPLMAGIVSALLIMVRIIPYILENYAYFAYAFFFGLIIFSITIPFRMMQKRWPEFLTLLVAAVAIFFLVGISRVSNAEIQFTVEHPTGATAVASRTVHTDDRGKWKLAIPTGWRDQTLRGTVKTARGHTAGSFTLTLPAAAVDGAGLQALDLVFPEMQPIAGEIEGQLITRGNPQPWFVLLSGALGICAMILPGISGAYILVILGQYKLVTSAARDFFDALTATVSAGQVAEGLWPAFTIICFFLLGIVLGIFAFVRLLKILLQRYHSLTMAALTGLMVGSLRSIWPVAHLHGEALSGTLLVAGVGLALFGAALIYALEKVSQKLGDPDSPV